MKSAYLAVSFCQSNGQSPDDVAFCFLDTEKEIYQDCYKAVIPNLVSGGLLVADNAISHQYELQPVIDQALNDIRVDAMVISVGKGLLVNRKI